MLAGKLWEIVRLVGTLIMSSQNEIGDLYELSSCRYSSNGTIDRVTARFLLLTECSRTSEGRNLQARGRRF